MAELMKGMGELPPREDREEDEELDAPVETDAPPTEDSKYSENEDGSVTVDLSDEDPKKGAEGDFDDNLAETLGEEYLDKLGLEYDELITQDIEARTKRDDQYSEGIKRTGMGGEAPGGAEFDGASRAVHPMLTKGCVDFASRAIKELFPASGPCKTQIIGEQTDAKLEKAERKKRYMNWQATTQVGEFRAELEKLLSQVPLGGAQYKRWWWDPELGRARTEAVFIDDIFTPYGHSDFYTSPRVTHRQKILRGEYDRRVRTGLYRELKLPEDSLMIGSEESKSQGATDNVEGVDPDAMSYNKDGLRICYQVEAQMQVEGDDEVDEDMSAPYVIHIDKESRKVLGLYRNWKEGDEKLRKKQWMSEWPFIPWRGGPAVGLAHIIGSMAGAATGALRAIIDAAHIANFPGGLMLDGGKNSGQSIQVNATELAKIAAPPGMSSTDLDIRKLVMPFPFSGPSAVLFQTLEWLTQEAEKVVATASEAIAEAGADMPVGTAMALIEHGSANFSAIHSRLHNAMKHDLSILHRLNSEHLSDRETIEDLGEMLVSRSDFEGPMDIIPVSDPNIFSEAQRYAQIQAVLQLQGMPQFASLFKPERLLARVLKLLQVQDVDAIANIPRDPKKLGAVEENYASCTDEEPTPLKVYADQDDMAHLRIHCQFATSPMFGANPLIAQGLVGTMLKHCKEHLLQLYKKHTEAAIKTAQLVASVHKMDIDEEELIVKATAFAEHMMATLLSPQVMPALEQMQKMAAAMAPKPPATPEVQLQEQTKMSMKTADLEAQAKEGDANRKAQAETARLTAAIDARQQESERALAQLTSQVELMINESNNAAKQLLAEFTEAKAAQKIVLQEVLAAAFEPPKPPTAGPPGADGKPGKMIPADNSVQESATNVLAPVMALIESSIQDALEGLNSNQLIGSVSALAQQQAAMEEQIRNESNGNAAALAQLASAIQTMQQATLARQNMQAEIFTGPDGVRRARMVPQQQPPQQQPPTIQ